MGSSRLEKLNSTLIKNPLMSLTIGFLGIMLQLFFWFTLFIAEILFEGQVLEYGFGKFLTVLFLLFPCLAFLGIFLGVMNMLKFKQYFLGGFGICVNIAWLLFGSFFIVFALVGVRV